MVMNYYQATDYTNTIECSHRFYGYINITQMYNNTLLFLVPLNLPLPVGKIVALWYIFYPMVFLSTRINLIKVLTTNNKIMFLILVANKMILSYVFTIVNVYFKYKGFYAISTVIEDILVPNQFLSFNQLGTNKDHFISYNIDVKSTL